MRTAVYHNPDLPAPEMTLLNAALNLMIRSTPESVTATQVFKSAGVSKATFYQYFSGREDVWSGLLLEEERWRLDGLDKLSNLADEDAWYHFFRSLFQYPDKLAALQQMETRLRASPPDLRRYHHWQALRSTVLDRMVTVTHRVAGCPPAESRQVVAGIWCYWEGWLRLYRDPEFSGLSGGRRQFAKWLARDCARRMTGHAQS
ncbi:MAG: TetR/AcrR family transcriptional regulator [Natronospirillum sp.]|uniref:TetR/AcrR family transcriptional regulator n=1 Tax=Natronospirillum sp. TaxID=2812955 RepID=UPI0025EB3008|nr:TetR/AcrR family transcriptional regulator [Natronospirillum sp.]MCH8551029.1 TetR/AcrR family transcriptional regulator [Natronospirillum sp.]